MPAAHEEFDVEAPPEERPVRAERSQHPTRSAAGFVILGLLLVAAGVMIAPRPEAGHGIVPHLADPPQLLWEVSLTSSHASAGQVWLGEEEVVAVGSDSMHAADLDTGAILWDLREPQLRCAREATDIACTTRQGTRAELIELTMADGEIDRTVQTGLIAALPHAGGLITLYDQSGTLAVMRSDEDGQHVWGHEVETDADLNRIAAAVLEDLVVILAQGVGGEPLLQVALEVGDGVPREGIEALPDPGGHWLVARDEAITWYSPEGEAIADYRHGTVLRVDDDPGSQVVFAGDGEGFRALSAGDGTQIWRHSAPGTRALPHARLAGTMVGWVEDTWYGLDAADGQVRWSRAGEAPRCPCLGSGTILTGVTGQTETALTAIDVTTGVQRWQLPLTPAAHFSFASDDTHLAVFSRHGLTLWSLQQR